MLRRRPKTPPVGVLVLTHGTGADALMAGARGIVGAFPYVQCICVENGGGAEGIVDRLSVAWDAVDQGSGVLILVDVHGSTPFHAAMSMLDGTQPGEVLCGVNLPMLIKLSTMDRQDTTPGALAETLRIVGRRSIRLGSELTGRVVLEEPG